MAVEDGTRTQAEQSNGEAASSPEVIAKDSIMKAACASATTGVTLKHGGPFGATVVRNGIFISLAHNTVLLDNDPTCHAEMNAIRYACAALDSHDLSDCELYTTCEPCPMCWGAIQWSRLKKIYTGVDRYTAAQFGFDDKVFYDELTAQSGHWAVKLGQNMPLVEPAMLEVFAGVGMNKVSSLLEDLEINKTYRRRVGEKTIGFHSQGERFGEDKIGSAVEQININVASNDSTEHLKYIDILEKAVRKAVLNGKNKEREVFASLIVDENGEVIATAVNEVLKRRDPTATGEILAIRQAAEKLGSYHLGNCIMYSTMEPDVMSLGAILWSRISKLYFGMSQNAAARYGFEEGLLHYRELFAEPECVEKVFCVERAVGKDSCEDVFKNWQQVNNIIY